MGAQMANGVKCAFLPRQIGGQEITAANLEERLNCRVLWGFDAADELPKKYTKHIGEPYLAFVYAYDELARQKGITKPTRVPELVVFDDDVSDVMFALAFKEDCFAQFTYTEKVGKALHKLNRECLLVRNFRTSLQNCMDSFEAYENAGHSGKHIVSNRISWFTSMSAAADTVHQYFEQQVHSIIKMIDSGW